MKKFIYTIAALAAASLSIVSCTKPIVIDNVNEKDYDNVTTAFGTLRDAATSKTTVVLDVRKDAVSTGVVFNTPRPATTAVNVTVSVDEVYAASYNQQHSTSFPLLPAAQVTIANGGKLTVPAGKKVSEALDLTIAPFADTEEKTYVLPLKTVVTAGDVKVSEEHLVYLVKNLSGQATAIRKEGEKSIFCYFEVNDTNPLNLLSWEMEDGRLLVDHLVLFAYNINYNKETGEVYVLANTQCQYILDHYNEIIKPLRDRGVKVILGLLGNHDESGLAQLSEIGCKDFAKKVADICYGYGFDGVNFDDEYSNSPDLSCPLFTSRSYAAGDRLIYECKQIMPDLLMTSYQYGQCRGRNAVDGHEPGEYLDITVGDYGVRAVVYPGMTMSQCAYQSSEFAQQRYLPTASTLDAFKASEYGYWMIFAPWGSNNQGGKTHFDELNVLAEGLYGSSLKKPSVYYKATTSLEASPIEW